MTILELTFKGRRKEYAKNPLQFPFQLGDPAIVEVERGFDLGLISHLGHRSGDDAEIEPDLSVLRKASLADLKVLRQNHQRETEAKKICRQKIKDHNLEMKLVDVELQWDGRKITFYFTADGRVDFRQLVKDLAGTFRTRIDLRQIGARDETKKCGGCGVCGQPLCCGTFLIDFKPITTQMPRDQFLPLNPSKLSGVCGRLKCCLRYELEDYRDFQQHAPKVGQPVKSEQYGEGIIDKLDFVREEVHVRYSEGQVEKYSLNEFCAASDWQASMTKNDPITLTGHKAPAITLPDDEPEPISKVESGDQSAEKVSLLAGGGIGLHGEDDEQRHDIGTDLDAKSKLKSRSKRRRGGRRTKKAGPKPEQAPAEAKQRDRTEKKTESKPKGKPVTAGDPKAAAPADKSPSKKKRRRGKNRGRSASKNKEQA